MKIVLAGKGAKMPTRADIDAAGYDLYTSEDVLVLPSHKRLLVPTGLKMSIDSGYEGHIRPRSGFSLKGVEAYFATTEGHILTDEPVRVEADVIQGTIDASYRGLIGIILKNSNGFPYVIKKGTRLAQMVIGQCYMGGFEQVEALEDTERSNGGFGHSGTN